MKTSFYFRLRIMPSMWRLRRSLGLPMSDAWYCMAAKYVLTGKLPIDPAQKSGR